MKKFYRYFALAAAAAAIMTFSACSGENTPPAVTTTTEMTTTAPETTTAADTTAAPETTTAAATTTTTADTTSAPETSTADETTTAETTDPGETTTTTAETTAPATTTTTSGTTTAAIPAGIDTDEVEVYNAGGTLIAAAVTEDEDMLRTPVTQKQSGNSVFIISVEPGTPASTVKGLFTELGLSIVYDYESFDMYAVSTASPLDAAGTQNLIEQLEDHDYILLAEPDGVVYTAD